MKIEDFIIEVIKQIASGCQKSGFDYCDAANIELQIQLNALGEVCKENEVAIGSIRIEL